MRESAVALVLLVAVAGCGSSGSTSSPKTDQQLADAAVLRQEDVPASFVRPSSSSSSASPGEDAAEAALDDCLVRSAGFSAEDLRKSRTAKALAKFKNSAVELEGEVEFYKTAEVVQQQIDLANQDAAIQCFSDAVKVGLVQRGIAVASATSAPRPSAPDVGDRSSAFSLMFNATVNQQGVTIQITNYMAKKGRALVSFSVTTGTAAGVTTTGVDSSIVLSAMETMTSRVP